MVICKRPEKVILSSFFSFETNDILHLMSWLRQSQRFNRQTFLRMYAHKT